MSNCCLWSIWVHFEKKHVVIWSNATSRNLLILLLPANFFEVSSITDNWDEERPSSTNCLHVKISATWKNKDRWNTYKQLIVLSLHSASLSLEKFSCQVSHECPSHSFMHVQIVQPICCCSDVVLQQSNVDDNRVDSCHILLAFSSETVSV